MADLTLLSSFANRFEAKLDIVHERDVSLFDSRMQEVLVGVCYGEAVIAGDQR